MFGVTEHHLLALLHHYGYEAVFVAIAGESMGIPMPGETMLVTASVFAGTTHQLNIGFVILAAVAGAIIGDNLGYLIGRWGGYRLLHRFGKYVFLTEKHLQVGEYLFYKYGGKIVFFGRFFTILRTWAAFLAGVNKMPWKAFLLFNTLGALLWADFYGLAGYFFGQQLFRVSGLLRYVMLNVGVLFLFATVIYTRYHVKRLEQEADKFFSKEKK